MRAFSSVLIAFVAIGCTATAPTESSSAALGPRTSTHPHCNTALDPLCTIMWEAPGIASCFTDDNPWVDIDQSGYLVSTKAPVDPNTGVYNLLVVGFAADTTFTEALDSDGNGNPVGSGWADLYAHKLWNCSLAPADLSFFQTMPGTIPFITSPTTTPALVKPDALPVQGGNDGVGQVGSADVGTGGGSEPGEDIIFTAADIAKLQSDKCVSKESTKADWCGTFNCGTVVDDCNVIHSCGYCSGVTSCSSDSGAGRCFAPPKIPNPPCIGKCI